ncbi:diiron oxygenase [Actinomadura soli]|uniref:Diiron oxygenase n=1 Tax=Actinomadura soli TaxID=2508997 RepID=A0A5C4JI99_9ACTN|nr:diiron oxygenase [Actinomadura soli]TMR06540.1 diiron oxygenase [Actinomadura soli]
MTNARMDDSPRLREILDRLSAMSIEDYYNPYQMFQWPDTLPEDMWWMSPELTTTFETEVAEELTREQLFALSRFESVNFYSLNVHGIRELLIEITERIHTDDFASASEFFHHFIGEENEHMWFFAEFCQRYGGKIYKQLRGGAETVPPGEAASLLVFARILIFEELVDHFNVRMASDERLDDTIRQINRIHHQDESRHIAFGRELVKVLFERFRSRATQEELDEVRGYLGRYLTYSFETLFNPQVYRDAGIPNPLEVRRRLLEGPRRHEFEAQVFRKTLPYLTKIGLVTHETGSAVPSVEAAQ